MLARLAIVLIVFYGTAWCHYIENKESDRDEKSVFKIPGLQWKPYTGPPVPEDAVLAGHRVIDGKEVSAHIGQVQIPTVRGAHLQAVAIYNNSDSVTSTYYETVDTSENIKILCGTKEAIKKLKWVSSEDEHHPDSDFVIIGHELSRVTDKETHLYIGRGTFDGTFLVGKVVMGSKSLRFYPFYTGYERLYKRDFEVLAYP